MPPVEFREWRQTVIDSQLEVQKHGFEANIIENHDEPRGVSRFLPEYARTPDGAKMLGTVSVLLRGIPFIYQGQEMGMRNAVWNSIDEFDDINTKDQYSIALQAGLSDKAALAACAAMSRDNARTPMQWSSDLNAGFTSGIPWLKVNSNYPDINVSLQETDPSSVLNYYRRLIALRKSPEYKEVFTYGEFAPVYMDTDSIMAYYRFDDSQRMLIAANFGPEAAEIRLEYPVKRVVLGNMGESASKTSCDSAESTDFFGDTLKLSSCEVVVIECEI